MEKERILVHDRVGVKGQVVPVAESSFIDIPEEFFNDLVKIQEYAQELENARCELGRLMQVTNHLINVCNTCDRNLANAKQGIIKGMKLEEGNWAIDFENKQIGKVASVSRPEPKVV
jgi:hypothetical protein